MTTSRTIVTTFVILLLTSQSLWADVRASLSRSTVQQGDTVTLNILASGDSDGEPDLSVLQEHFDIVGTGSSQQTSIINGQISSSRQWQIELMPRGEGELSVPPVPVGKHSTRAMTLTVSKLPDATVAEAGEPLFIKTQLEPVEKPVYVQQQLRYTLQIFYREQLYDGGFDGPHADNALVERLGDDLQYQTTVNGQPYQVVERHYAIFPEQSGKLAISPVTFNGRLAGPARQRMPSMQMNDMMKRFFGSNTMASPGKRVRLRGEGYELDVQPRPAGYSGQDWLPAAQLVLTDSWTDNPPEFRTGEPVTRTLSLEAKGLESTHLPDITLREDPGMRLYSEAPAYKNRTDGEWVYGSVSRTFAYMPTTTGLQTLPEIAIDWWDTASDEQKTTRLPAWTINVQPGEGMINTHRPPPEAVPGEHPEPPLATVSHRESAEDETSGRLVTVSSYGPWLLAGIILLAGIVVLNRRRHVNPHATKPTVPRRAARTALQQACRQHEAAAAARALLDWAGTEWRDDPPRSLGALAGRLAVGGEAVRALEQALYGAGDTRWQGEELWRVLAPGLQPRSESGAATHAGLSPLYPDWKA